MKKIKLLLSTFVVAASLVSLSAAASSYDSTLLNNNKMSIGISQNVDSKGLIEKNPTPWTVGSWGDCSAKCGNSEGSGGYYTTYGTQFRSVTCNDPSGVCEGSKPATSQTCYRTCWSPNRGH